MAGDQTVTTVLEEGLMARSQRFVATALALALLSGCAHLLDLVGRPSVAAVRPRVTGIDLESVSLAFDLDINNPYPVPLKSSHVKYGFDVEGAQLFESGEPVTLDIPAKGTGTMTLPVRLAYADISKVHGKLADAKEFDYTIRSSVALAAGERSYELPLSHSGTLPILRRPTFSNISLNRSEPTLDGAGLTIEADMLNPNVFELGVKQLGYLINLGDTEVGELTASTADSVGAGKSTRITLTGKISAAKALLGLKGLGSPSISPSGAIETPYGAVRLQQ
jgi:LEA14-like dessication related protein